MISAGLVSVSNLAWDDFRYFGVLRRFPLLSFELIRPYNQAGVRSVILIWLGGATVCMPLPITHCASLFIVA